MSKFDAIVLTDSGANLLDKCIAESKTLYIDEIVLGDGYLPEGSTPEQMTALVSQKQEVSIESKQFTQTGVVTIIGRLKSADITTGFYVRELGIMAHEDGQAPILYMYCNTGDYADYLPAGGVSEYVDMIYKIATKIGNAQNVVINIDSQVNFETDLTNYIDEFTTTDQQQSFILTNTHINGDLAVIIDGLARFDWSIQNSSIVMDAPLAAGLKVHIIETRASVESALINVRLFNVFDKYTATDGQTTFPLQNVSVNGVLSVFKNNLQIFDYSLLGDDLVLVTPATAGDKLVIKQISSETIFN
jgi:hypothetical protein